MRQGPSCVAPRAKNDVVSADKVMSLMSSSIRVVILSLHMDMGARIKKKTLLTSSDLAVFPSAPSRPECSQWRKVCVYRHRPRDRTSRSFSPSPACPPMTEDYRWCHHRPIAWSLPTDRRARRRGPRRSPKKAMSIAPRPRADVARVATVQVDAHYLHSWSFSSSMAAWLLILWRLHAANRGP